MKVVSVFKQVCHCALSRYLLLGDPQKQEYFRMDGRSFVMKFVLTKSIRYLFTRIR